MLENQIYILLRSTIASQILARQGAPLGLGIKVRRQPQQEGRPTAPTVYIDKVADKRYGWRQSESRWDAAAGIMRLYEAQAMETTLQITFQQISSTDPTALTASDVAQIVAATCQSDKFIATIGRSGVQVLRVTDVRNLPYKNDLDQWEFVPSFDLVIKHTNEYVDSVPVVTVFEFDIHAVPDII